MAEHPNLHRQAPYGGEGWRPRRRSAREEIGDLWAACGISTEWSRLHAVLLYRPGDELAASVDPAAVSMLEPLDIGRAQAQHAVDKLERGNAALQEELSRQPADAAEAQP